MIAQELGTAQQRSVFLVNWLCQRSRGGGNGAFNPMRVNISMHNALVQSWKEWEQAGFIIHSRLKRNPGVGSHCGLHGRNDQWEENGKAGAQRKILKNRRTNCTLEKETCGWQIGCHHLERQWEWCFLGSASWSRNVVTQAANDFATCAQHSRHEWKKSLCSLEGACGTRFERE